MLNSSDYIKRCLWMTLFSVRCPFWFLFLHARNVGIFQLIFFSHFLDLHRKNSPTGLKRLNSAVHQDPRSGKFFFVSGTGHLISDDVYFPSKSLTPNSNQYNQKKTSKSVNKLTLMTGRILVQIFWSKKYDLKLNNL